MGRASGVRGSGHSTRGRSPGRAPTTARRPKKQPVGSARGRPAAKKSAAGKAPSLKSPRVARKPAVGGEAKAQKLPGIERSAPKEPAGKATTVRGFESAPVSLPTWAEASRNAPRATPQLTDAQPGTAVPKMPQPGDPAPDFELPDTSGNLVRLSHLRGKRVVLYFYPKDDTPGCTLEAQGFRDDFEAFRDRDVLVYGISKDDQRSHEAFTQKYRLTFPLLSDTSGKTVQDYGCWVEKNNYGRTYMGIQRATFLIDEHGRVDKIWPKVTPEGHSREILATLDR